MIVVLCTLCCLRDDMIISASLLGFAFIFDRLQLDGQYDHEGPDFIQHLSV